MEKIQNGDIIDGEKVREVLYEFKVLRHEWECDGYGWAVSLEGKPNKIVLTDHGKKYIAKWEDLNKIVETYKKIAQETNNAIALL